MRRCVLGFAIAVLIAGSVGFAQGKGRVFHDRYVTGLEEISMGDCADYGVGSFEIWNDYQASIHDAILFDEDGVTPKLVVENFKVISDVFYNSTNPTKRIAAGPGENQEVHYRYENGKLVSFQWSGPVVRVNLPGYGPIYSETGVFKRLWYEGSWHFIMNTAHNQWVDGDIEALCWALK